MPYLFNGKELDTETGLYYYGARYYDAKTSIFLNVDPLAEKTMQPYAYANNNPVMLIDPTGMEGEEPPIQCCKWIKEYTKGAWSTGINSISSLVTSNNISQTKQGVQEMIKVYDAYQKGGISMALNQYGKSIYETSGAKNIIDIGKGVIEGNPKDIGASVTIITIGILTHKASNNTRVATINKAESSIHGQIPALSQYKQYWKSGSLSEIIDKFTPNSLPILNSKRTKHIYLNTETKTKVIYDINNKYFRIQDKEGHYLDLSGKRINAPSNLQGKEASNYVKKNTHFKNLD